MLTIIDTSVAIKWFIADEPKREAAMRILKEIERDPTAFAVPELFFNEMLSVLCRLSKDPTSTKGYLADLADLGFSRIGNGKQLLEKACELACQFNIAGYDAIFAASAVLVEGKWITADERAIRKITHTGKVSWAALLV